MDGLGSLMQIYTNVLFNVHIICFGSFYIYTHMCIYKYIYMHVYIFIVIYIYMLSSFQTYLFCARKPLWRTQGFAHLSGSH